MTDLDANAFSESLNEVQAALSAFASGPAREAADEIARAFEQSGARIARALAGASLDGQSAMRALAKTVLEELARAALARLELSNTPAQNSASPMAFTLNFGAGSDAPGILRHQGQIAAQIARAVAYGSRNL